MKTLTTLTLLMFLSSIGLAQTTHSLTGYDNYFDPDTLVIQAGDTIAFTSIGYHSATEVDSLDWVNNTATHNGGFWVGFSAPTSSLKFTLDTPGTYYNICVPHAGMGMKSIIIVAQPTIGIDEASAQNDLLYPNPANHSIVINNSRSVLIYDITGQLVLRKSNLSLSERLDISTLPKGHYVVVLDHGKQKLIVE